MEYTRFVGLDVHVSSISVAVAEEGRGGAVEYVGRIDNNRSSVAKVMKKLSRKGELHCCYEAGPCGYVLYRQLTSLGVRCEVIAPSLIPRKAGDRVKTDRRDALSLAHQLRSGDLTPVWVPDEAHEALRDLIRSREAAKADELRAKQRLEKLLHRCGLRKPTGTKAWSYKHRRWLDTLTFEHLPRQQTYTEYLNEVKHRSEQVARIEEMIRQALDDSPSECKEVVSVLQGFRGIGFVTSATLISEIGQFLRFGDPKQLMAYVGMDLRAWVFRFRLRTCQVKPEAPQTKNPPNTPCHLKPQSLFFLTPGGSGRAKHGR